MAKAFVSERERNYHNRLQNDFSFFARWCLKIRTKLGSMDPLVLNEAQRYIHAQVEHQIQTTGKIRAIVLKGRQQGCSTYVGGRFYWRTTRLSGKATFILSHEASTTEKLFQMVDRYHKNCPDPVKMQTDVANQRRMVFAGLNSEYFVGTAGNEDVGRGGTVQYLHASEAAFYPSSSGFSTGLLQSVPDAPGTEVFIESTANGMDPLFYPMCMNAMAGKGEFILIFVPWFWQTEYRKTLPPDFQKDEDESKIAALFNLDDMQIYWRRMKIFELKDVTLFMREYPNTVEEAFTVSGESLIPSIKVMEARKSIIDETVGPKIWGIDPNDAGGPVGWVKRQGRRILSGRIIEGVKPMDLAGRIAREIDDEHPDKVFMDCGNGYGVIDRLHELGYEKIVIAVAAGEGSIEETVYLNKRAEMGCALANWFINGPVRCPDDNLFHKHMTSVPAKIKTSSSLTKLESKEKIIKDTQIDPHLFDAAALTFAYPVRSGEMNKTRQIKKVEKAKSPLSSNIRRDQYRQGQAPGQSATASVRLS